MRSASVHRCIRCSTYRIEAHAESPFELGVAATFLTVDDETFERLQKRFESMVR